MRLAGSIWTIVTVCTRLVLTRVLKLIQARCFVDGKMVFGICYFHKWRLDLLLCPATTLMHSAVEKLDSDLLWRTVTAIYHSIRTSRLVSVDRSISMRFEFLASCTLFGRSVAPRTLSTSLSPFDPRFDVTSTLLPRRPHPDAKHSISKVCILCA